MTTYVGEYKCIISNASGQTQSTCNIGLYDDGSSKLNEQLKRKAKINEQNYNDSSAFIETHSPITLSRIKGKLRKKHILSRGAVDLQMWNCGTETEMISIPICILFYFNCNQCGIYCMHCVLISSQNFIT